MLNLTPDETEREAYATGRQSFTAAEYRALLAERDEACEALAQAEALPDLEAAAAEAEELRAWGNRLRDALIRVLECPDRGLDSLEPETEAIIAAGWAVVYETAP